jgi:hypothetical protein
VEKWDVMLDSREEARVVLEVGVKWDRAMKLCPAGGGVVKWRLGVRARSLQANVLCIRQQGGVLPSTYKVTQ